ncbi:MAG: Rv1355c family protein [Cytophagaceae bacterium]
MTSFLTNFFLDRNKPEIVYKPEIFDLKNPYDKSKLEELTKSGKVIQIYDQILGQTEELVKSLNPKIVYKKPELTKAATDYINSNSSHPDEFGVWVYYPWSGRLIHVLSKEDFIEVRTNRNNYKISPAEREILFKKRIGVVGLSIGQSIAMTLATERIFGEIRLADFDIIELSNLNRIRTGIQNLGVSKVVAVAREIAELDPFLNVTCFLDGLTEENMDEYFLGNGKLDLVVEACDGLDIKILSRRKAKSLGIPVVMDTSDRGMIDIERFDLEPGRPILHGLIEHLDSSKLKGLTNEEKVPFLLAIIGIDTMSDRLKASMLEIEQSITTWPQLASSVTLGGGVTTDVCRRILLNQLKDSGRYFIDVEEIITDKEKPVIREIPLNIRPSLTFPQMMDIIRQSPLCKVYPEQEEIDSPTLNEIIKAAGMAPSGANIQPWRWIYDNKNLYLFFDDVYSAGLLDCGNTISFASLGAAVENLVLKAHEKGLEVLQEKPVLKKDTQLVAVFHFFKTIPSSLKDRLEKHVCDNLVKVIPDRLTNRNIRKRQPIAKDKLKLLQEAARTVPGAEMKLIDDEKTLQLLGEVTAKMDRIRVMHEGGHKDFRAEIRWTREEALQACNGVDLMGTVDLTQTELAGWRIAKSWPVIKLLNDWRVGSGLEKIQRKNVAGATALGLLTVPSFSCDTFYDGGRAMERVWLKATELNISVHPASLSTLIWNTLMYNEEDVFPDYMREEARQLRKQFEEILSLQDKRADVILFRFFISDPPKERAVRYPIEKILYVNK